MAGADDERCAVIAVGCPEVRCELRARPLQLAQGLLVEETTCETVACTVSQPAAPVQFRHHAHDVLPTHGSAQAALKSRRSKIELKAECQARGVTADPVYHFDFDYLRYMKNTLHRKVKSRHCGGWSDTTPSATLHENMRRPELNPSSTCQSNILYNA